MDNTMTKSGAVQMAGALPRVWNEWPQPATGRRAVTVAPVQGTTLPSSGLARLGTGTGTGIPFLATAVNYITVTFMDVRPFRTARPPI